MTVVKLGPRDTRLLRKIARSELRTPDAQVALLVRAEAERRGLRAGRHVSAPESDPDASDELEGVAHAEPAAV